MLIHKPKFLWFGKGFNVGFESCDAVHERYCRYINVFPKHQGYLAIIVWYYTNEKK